MKTFIKWILPLCFVACTTKEQPKENKNQDLHFNSFKENFIERFWQLNPNWGSIIGYHKYDSVLTIPDNAHYKKQLEFARQNNDSLKLFVEENLNPNNKTDLYIIKDFLAALEWDINKFKGYTWMPSQYNVSEGFADLLNNNYDSLDKRLESYYLRVQHVPAYYNAAKKNLINPTKEHTELAISQNEGGLSVFKDELEAALKKSNLPSAKKDSIRSRAQKAATAVLDYAKWLKQLPDTNNRSFRLGKELYQQKFSHDIQSGYSADEIYQKALEHKKNLHDKMFAITQTLWTKYFKSENIPGDKLVAIRRLIDHLSTKHVKPDSFQTAIEKQIPQLVDFIKKKNLLYIDPSKPLVVRKEPAYMAGLAGASISSPGPYDKNGNTYYNVGSFSGWKAERIESYLREYNHYILQILNIHEAIPGHYTQLVYSNQSPSIIKSIFGNGALVEGWAVYTELMMLENGYGSSSDSIADPEMWLMYYKWNLRSTCNTILDYGIHVNNMQKEEVINLLMNEAFQQQAEADGKWRRATLSQVQLCSYFTGFTEICALREEIKKKEGKNYSLKLFHEKFLSYGSAPVKYIRQLMLEKN